MGTKTTIYCDGAASMKCVNGEYIRENGKSKWQYRAGGFKLEAAHCSYEHLEYRLCKEGE